MSTRSVIARATPTGFKGRYHHWDGYPEGLGATLFQIHREVFSGDTGAMLKTLLDKHPAGWSTINGADWSLKPGNVPYDEQPCKECGEPNWKHYIQSYESHGLPKPPPGPAASDAAPALALDHQFMADLEGARRPECHCHDMQGKRNKDAKAWLVTERNASGSGCEWAYVFTPRERVMAVCSSYVTSIPEAVGQKMIGFFGMGDPDAEWKPVAIVDLDGPEPDWQAIAESAYAL
jgi:hypothetical protein